MLTPWKESYDQPRQHIKKQRHYFKAMVFPVVMYGCESWTIKKLSAEELMLLNCNEIQPVHPKGDQSWVFIGRTDAEAETPILWPPDVKSWLIWKDHDAGKDWGQKEKGTTGWDGWMASLTQWTWVWVNCGSWWWTGRPGILWFMRSQRVRHYWATKLNWLNKNSNAIILWLRSSITNISYLNMAPNLQWYTYNEVHWSIFCDGKSESNFNIQKQGNV